VLYLARADDRAAHRGTVVAVERSVFAPPAALAAAAAAGTGGPTAFRLAYVARLRAVWRRERGAFLALIGQARVGDVTLVDGFGDVGHAPRRILGATLKQIAATERAGERLREQRRADRAGAAR
jgi:hypothetical protein